MYNAYRLAKTAITTLRIYNNLLQKTHTFKSMLFRNQVQWYRFLISRQK